MMMVTWRGGRLGDMYHREQYCHCRRWTLLGQAHIAKDVFTILQTCDLSKILHDRIFRPKISHIKSA